MTIKGAEYRDGGNNTTRYSFTAKLGQDISGKAADPHLQAAEICRILERFPKPAAHLTARVSGQERDNVVGLQKLVEEFGATADLQPGRLHPAVQAERHGGADRKCRVLANVVVSGRMGHFHGAVRCGIERLQPGNDFARSEDLNLKFVVGSLRHCLRKHLGRAENGVERFRKAGGQTPFYFRRRLGDSG